MPKRESEKPKLFKIRRTGEPNKYGVAAFTLKELIKKGCELFQMKVSKAQCCLYEDGTVITDDYFHHVPNNSEVVLLAAGQSWSGSMVYDISQVLGLDRHADELISAAKNLLQDDGEELPAKRKKLLGDLLHNLQDNADLENRAEDADWFVGIDTRFKTKSAYMKFNCEQRIRGYLKEVDGHTNTILSSRTKGEYKKLVMKLVERLKVDRYNGSYFDRTEKERNRLCTDDGWFSCQGAFDQDTCQSVHSINPYGNRESRILFSTWNLDHKIEKKRTIIPSLVEALDGRKSSDINEDYFYKLLFTRANLKLVHIVCHKKGAHDLKCDSRQVYKLVKTQKK